MFVRPCYYRKLKLPDLRPGIPTSPRGQAVSTQHGEVDTGLEPVGIESAF